MKVTAKETVMTYMVEMTEMEAKAILQAAHDFAGRGTAGIFVGKHQVVIDLGQQLHELGVRP